jgi:RNA-binding protein
LIKVRLAAADREAREQAAEDIAEALSCAVVQIIGNVLVLFRPRPEED